MPRDRDDEPIQGPGLVLLVVVLCCIFLMLALDRGCVP